MELRHGLLVLAITACGGHAAAPTVVASKPAVVIDVFDPDPSVADHVSTALEPELRAYADHAISADALRARVRTLGEFAYVEAGTVTYYKPTRSYLTLDLVEQRDAARRMPFAAPPRGTYADPAGLLADWQAYEKRFHELLGANRLALRPYTCPVFHCVIDPAEPELRDLAARFPADVPAHVDELATILRDDADENHRASAAFLLAYTTDGAHLVQLLIPATRDPGQLVRNNVLRVLAEIARNHPDVEVPIEPLLEALEFPAATDRNKASAALDGLLRHPGAERDYATVAARSGTTLLAMLRLQQPNNHDFAYKILETISGKTFGERDYAAWQTWLRSASSPDRR